MSEPKAFGVDFSRAEVRERIPDEDPATRRERIAVCLAHGILAGGYGSLNYQWTADLAAKTADALIARLDAKETA